MGAKPPQTKDSAPPKILLSSKINISLVLAHLGHFTCQSENLHAEVLVAQRTLHDAKSISNALDKLKPLKQGFSTLWNLLHLALTFPVSNAKCERSFSVLKLVKTYIRATMGQKRLTSLGTISIEKGVVDSLDLDVVVDKFASLPIQSQSNLGKSTIRRMSLTHT